MSITHTNLSSQIYSSTHFSKSDDDDRRIIQLLRGYRNAFRSNAFDPDKLREYAVKNLSMNLDTDRYRAAQLYTTNTHVSSIVISQYKRVQERIHNTRNLNAESLATVLDSPELSSLMGNPIISELIQIELSEKITKYPRGRKKILEYAKRHHLNHLQECIEEDNEDHIYLKQLEEIATVLIRITIAIFVLTVILKLLMILS